MEEEPLEVKFPAVSIDGVVYAVVSKKDHKISEVDEALLIKWVPESTNK